MIVTPSIVRGLMIGLVLAVAWAGPVAESPSVREALLKRSSLLPRAMDWRVWPFFNEKFQENFDGPPPPTPTDPNMEYWGCIFKWLYQLQRFKIVAGQRPSPEDFLKAHANADRICKETAQRRWGQPATYVLTPQRIEQYNREYKKAREEFEAEERRQGGDDGGGRRPGNGNDAGRGFGRNPNNNPFQLTRGELLQATRQTFSSAVGSIQATLRDPSWGPALWSSVSRTIRHPVGATAPRPVVGV